MKWTVLLSGLVLTAAVAHADNLALAKKLTQAIKQHDDGKVAKMLVGVAVSTNRAKKPKTLATKKAATAYIESVGGLETKGGETCADDCCTWSDNQGNGWGDVPSHPQKACFTDGKLVSLILVRGSE